MGYFMKNAYDIDGFVSFVFYKVITEMKDGFECEDVCLDAPFFLLAGSTINLGDANSSPSLTSR